MNPFLVKAKVRKTYYMVDNPVNIDEIRIVFASDEKEAKAKFEKFMEDQNDPHYVSY